MGRLRLFKPCLDARDFLFLPSSLLESRFEQDRGGGDHKSDLMVRWSVDHGLSWMPSVGEFATDLGDLDTRFPAIAVGPAGVPYVAWIDLRDGASSSSVFVAGWTWPTDGLRRR